MKKAINKRIIAIVFLLGFIPFLNSCTNLTANLSTDPVNVTDPSVIAISKYLTGVEVSLIGVYEADMARLSGMWSGYFSGDDRQYIGLANYVTSGQDYDGEWSGIYNNVLENTMLIKTNARMQSNNVALGIAQAIEGMSYGLAADLWGDVPYKEAIHYPAITTPKYDGQASVYAAAQSLLDSAIANLALPGTSTGDFLLNGSVAGWTAVAHTVKARLYLHTRDYANAITQAQLGIGSVAGNLMATHGESYLNTFNMYYSFMTYDRSGYMAANSYAPALLDNTKPNNRNNANTDETARLNYYYYPGGGLNFIAGAVAYEPNVLCDFDWGNPTNQNGFFGGTTSFPIVTYQENQLILAESYAKTADPANALISLNALRAYYNTGAHVNSGYVALGNKYLPYLYSDFASGGMENADGIAQDQALLREILEERYVTFIGQIEGYNDMRRTGNFLKLPYATGKTDFPRRFLYSQIEINTNPNVPKTNVGLYDNVSSFSSAY
ncbi:MAG: SusD/RagB family nutrient-binding outer membrane lipoprotein [Bacteroidetes bacterium]|nr:SusD/RagB family nutrient-binding outer membrane lipoprotein [Bacteroidota bacterium]